MSGITQREMIAELYQVVIGIPNNPDANGLVGDITEIKKQVTLTNGMVNLNVSKITRLETKSDAIEIEARQAKEYAADAKSRLNAIRQERNSLVLSRNQSIAGGSAITTFIVTLILTLGRSLGWW